jgi:hypothetical protein
VDEVAGEGTEGIVVGCTLDLLRACPRPEEVGADGPLGRVAGMISPRIDHRTERLDATLTLVLVPSLSLLSQTLREWTVNATSAFASLAVCSDETVAEHDAVVATTTELDMPATKEAESIASFLAAKSRRVIFATYQSSHRIAEAYRFTVTTALVLRNSIRGKSSPWPPDRGPVG